MEVAASISAIVDKARTSWLKNHEVLELLQQFIAAGLSVCQEPPVRPEGGQLFLFDRRTCRFFRRDGHNWRKKPDGKTIRETHEKLKVGNTETLNCYYAHADQENGLQRRCYWQLDPEYEHIVLVHYLCCASSRAGGSGAAQRAGSAELGPAEPRERPRRSSAARRAYSPPAPAARGRVGGSQPRLSPLAQSSGSLDATGSLPDDEGLPELPLDMPDLPDMALPLGISLEQAAALPSLAQQFAMEQAMQQAQQAQQAQAAARAMPPPPLPLPHPPLPPVSVPHHFHLSAEDLSRPLPGVLYTGQRMASQLAAAQQHVAAAAHHDAAGMLAAAAAAVAVVDAGGVGGAAPPMPRPLFPLESFTSEVHRQLFREMSLGIQREAGEETGGYFLGSPTERSLDPVASGPPAGKAGSAGSGDAGAGTPSADLVALLGSPQHMGSHRRTVSRQGSGLSRLISKNWESELPLEMMLADVDADISTYPVGGGVVADAAERPSSPSSRMFDQAGIAFLGSAGVVASTAHTLEPSPLGTAGLAPLRSGASPAGVPPLFALHASAPGSDSGTPTFSSPPAHVQFSAGAGATVAQRASRERAGRRDIAGAAGMARSGSHPALTHLARRSANPAGEGSATPEEVEAQQRRQERVEAAVVAAQEHRDEALAAARRARAARTSEEAEEDGMEMIDVPENMLRLSSFISRGRQTTGGQRELAAMATEALELETRGLFKHMSIDEADAVAAVAAAKELEVMPTIHANGSSELEVTGSGLRSRSGQGSQSDELGSRDLSDTSVLAPHSIADRR